MNTVWVPDSITHLLNGLGQGLATPPKPRPWAYGIDRSLRPSAPTQDSIISVFLSASHSSPPTWMEPGGGGGARGCRVEP